MSDDPNANSTVTAAYARLLALAVHELRTPASVVGGYLRMLQRDTTTPLSDWQRKMVDEAEKSHERLVALIAELGEIAKLDVDPAPVHRESCDLFALAGEAAADIRGVGVDGMQVEVRGEPAPAPALGDRARLRRAFAACLHAVVREQPAACTIVVDRRRRGSGSSAAAVVIIARESELDWASRADPMPFDQHRGGLGLALPIAARVIGQHGGQIWSPAPAEGEGATHSAIVIALPVGGAG